MNKSSVLAAALAAASFSAPGVAQSYSYAHDVLDRPIPAARSAAPAPLAAGGDDRAEVLSSTPVIRQVRVPQRHCTDQPVAVQRQPSGAGALIGAVAGAAVGNAVGAGSGRAVATAIGMVGGAALGNEVETGGADGATRYERRCSTQAVYEERTVGYDVVYAHGGREYTTRMRQQPGAFIDVRVNATPVGEAAPEATLPRRRGQPVPLAQAEPYRTHVEPAHAEPVYIEPAYAGHPYPAYPAYSVSPYHAPSYAAPLGAGLVLGALIGYGFNNHRSHAWHGGHRGGWHGGRRR